MPNRFTPLNPNSDMSNMVNQINQNFAQLDNENVTKVFKGANSDNKLIEGRLPNSLGYGMILYDANGLPSIYMAVDNSGNPIMKVAKPGKDATTAGNSDLIFNSSQNVFKIISTGTLSMPSVPAATPGGSQTRTVDVSTDIVAGTPLIVMGFYSDGRILPHNNLRNSGSFYAEIADTTSIFSYIDNGFVVVRAVCTNYYDAGSAGNFTIRYYILQETST